jgi:hypothetical protein
MNISTNQEYRHPPVIDVPERKSWLRVEIHFSAVLLFYGCTVGTIMTLAALISYNKTPLESLAVFALGAVAVFVYAAIDWLRLLFLGWVTRKLGSMA